MMLQRTLNRLWRDKFSARSLKQIFLAVGYIKEAVFIEPANVTGFEPAVLKCLFGFLGLIPIGTKNRWPANQNLSIVGDLHLHVPQRLSHAADAMSGGRIHGDHRRSLG